jgi:hypothetical protein
MSDRNAMVLPTLKQRVAVIGKTGSGKSVFGLWLLSRAAFDLQPFVIVDYKHEDIVKQIDYARVIGFNETPKHPGIYILRPGKPTAETDKAVEDFIWNLWERGGTGLFFDETAELPKHYGKGAVHAVLTQGRSKRIPVIACTQRPSGVAPAIFTEADFFACFHLQKPEDVANFARYTPWHPKQIIENRLPPHWCRWYDSPRDVALTLRPCPSEEIILDTFHKRLGEMNRPRRRFL